MFTTKKKRTTQKVVTTAKAPSDDANAIVKAISDLRTVTMIRGMPRVKDIARHYVKNRRVYTMASTASFGTLSLIAATDLKGAISVSLSLFGIGTTAETLFDTYKIQELTIRFIPLGTLPSGGGYNPLLTVIDYDDAGVLSSFVQAQAYDTCQETPMGQYVERTFVPRVALQANSTGNVFAGSSQKTSWIDCSGPTVPHFGVKYYAAGPTTAFPSLYEVEIDAIISFMSVR